MAPRKPYSKSIEKLIAEREKVYDRQQRYLDRLAPYLGNLVITFNSLEDSLDQSIVESFGEIEEIGYAVISGLSFLAKVELLGRVYGPMFQYMSDPKWSVKLAKILQQLKEANTKRNDMIHGAWFDYNIKTKKVRTKTRIHQNQLEKVEKKIQIGDVSSATKFISKLDDTLYLMFVDGAGSWF